MLARPTPPDPTDIDIDFAGGTRSSGRYDTPVSPLAPNVGPRHRRPGADTWSRAARGRDDRMRARCDAGSGRIGVNVRDRFRRDSPHTDRRSPRRTGSGNAKDSRGPAGGPSDLWTGRGRWMY